MEKPFISKAVQPSVILVNPQLGENIGAAARVMHNFGLKDLRLIAPRDSWPNTKAEEMACNARHLIDTAALYGTVEASLQGIDYLVAATARPRDMVKPVLSPRKAVSILAEHTAAGRRCAMMFGPERSGLANSDVILADAIVSIPVNPEYPSLNLAQSIAVLCYEWFVAAENGSGAKVSLAKEVPASKVEIQGFFSHLERLLDEAEFFKVPEKKERMLHNIKNLFIRAAMNEQDVRTLRGILTALENK